eukprot:423174-Alexandrium_andersonii.AAC.1
MGSHWGGLRVFGRPSSMCSNPARKMLLISAPPETAEYLMLAVQGHAVAAICAAAPCFSGFLRSEFSPVGQDSRPSPGGVQ